MAQILPKITSSIWLGSTLFAKACQSQEGKYGTHNMERESSCASDIIIFYWTSGLVVILFQPKKNR